MDMGKWRGLFEWSMKYQDGTRPSDWKPEEFTPERRQWLQEALKQYWTDLADRMKEIKQGLDKKEDEASIQDKEKLLEELMDIVSSIDYARDLHKIGGLRTLLDLLECQYPSLRWRAAEVVATCVQNNPPVQQWFMEGGVMAPLLSLFEDSDVSCRTKALHALSSLMRHHAPGLAAFRAAGGLAKLLGVLRHSERRLVRKALAALQYVLAHSVEDCRSAVELGGVAPLAALVEGDDSDQRSAALEPLLMLAKTHSGWAALKQLPDLHRRLDHLLTVHRQLGPDEAEAQEEEGRLLQLLLQDIKRTTPPAEELREMQDDISVDEHERALPANVMERLRREQQQREQQQNQRQPQQQQQSQPTLALMPPMDPDPR